MLTGKFYGIGVGPGDPDLITVKAVKTLQQIDVVIAPQSNRGANSTALAIARPHLSQTTEILELVFPMVEDSAAMQEAWEANKGSILSLLQQGKQVAFLTLGDPMLYSTYIYILRLLAKEQVKVETIPGITSFCASASRASFPLGEGNDIVTIIPATCEPARLQKALEVSDNVILMKVSRNTPELLRQLQLNGLSQHAVMVSKCGHPDESVHYDINNLAELKPTYLSTILARKHPTGV
ncbi:precorrin-2 C(20)-methyltransferase [Desulforamulus ferrireducens]|uniref:Precorrin-2 C(20)-methyltransferase n=1 Tax=Desulforamulus ferrireducens TaxID=1833852 RepID=A0A1S6IZ82_9FIRM|nr:precorrin-2 C(20)-methyltransferase [Desulforamulus ferrireducens]AQS60085.1 precorrin-2 C(20)-methyltransferase [Desulforamulus ferrireducens]